MHFTENPKETSLHGGWKQFPNRFCNLKRFFGRLATVFRSTATGEADFSFLRRNETPERLNISKLALEGAMHAQQRKKVLIVTIV